MNMDMVCCLHIEVSIPQKEKTNQHKAYKHRINSANSGTYYLGGHYAFLRKNISVKNWQKQEQGLAVILLCTSQHMNFPVLF